MCSRRFENEILTKDWATLTDEDFSAIGAAGYRPEAHVKLPVADNNSFNSVYCFNVKLTPSELKERVITLMSDDSLGKVFRIKGFVRDGDGWAELNATKQDITVKKVAAGQEIVIVIGENLDTAGIYRHFGIDAETIADVKL